MSKLTKALTAAAGNAGGGALYAEDVFSTYLYTGNATARDITNGIDLAGEGGLVWVKSRSNAGGHVLIDTERGAGKLLRSNSTDAEADTADTQKTVNGFNDDGFSLGTDSGNWGANFNNYTYASWSFRKAEKFFDVVTYTGNGTNGREIPHSLAGDVGMVIVKCTSDSDQWLVWHKSTPTGYLRLDGTGALVTSFAQFKFGNGTTTVNPTSSVFTVAGDSDINGSGRTYVAYLFASDAGGFGDDDESIIKCGSFAHNSSGATVDCGFEPQWILVKAADQTNNWYIFDVMRGIVTGGSGGDGDAALFPNTSGAENVNTWGIDVNATGFTVYGNNILSSGNAIYTAIRRPMKTPESGTEVFSPIVYTGNATADTERTTGILTDLIWSLNRQANAHNASYDRMRGASKRLLPSTTAVETSETGTAIGVSSFAKMDGYIAGADQGSGSINFNTWTYVNYAFKRATGFFDVVAYSGTGSAHAEAHNLGVIPEMIIVKSRSNSFAWTVYQKDAPISGSVFEELNLNDTNAWSAGNSAFPATAPTSTGFYLPSGTASASNRSGWTYIAYLFASVAGVSKVGSYTGTGSNVNVDCGFSAGARFILIKRTDSTGDWYTYDSARGIVAGNDPYLLLNSTAAEVTSTDYIDPLSSGFTVTSSAPAALNASGGTYIFLAIA